MQIIEKNLRENHLDKAPNNEPPDNIDKERTLSRERADEIIKQLKEVQAELDEPSDS